MLYRSFFYPPPITTTTPPTPHQHPPFHFSDSESDDPLSPLFADVDFDLDLDLNMDLEVDASSQSQPSPTFHSAGQSYPLALSDHVGSPVLNNQATESESGGSTTGYGIVPRFVEKLYEIIETPEYEKYIQWNEVGDAFVVFHFDEFAEV
ncbi:hypothetical protein HK097_010470, partial [Rhizophlyctis rosea]